MATDYNVEYGGRYVDPIVQSVKWSGDIPLPYRTLIVTLSNTINGKTQAVTFELGKEIRFHVSGAEVFRGVIFSTTIDHSGRMSITAYDENVYLTKNSDTRKFTKMTATAIAKQLCQAFDISAGTFAASGYVIPKLTLRNMTLWDMLVTAFTVTHKQNGKRMYVYSRKGKFHMAERKDVAVRWILENGVNITGASRTQSIEETRTVVKVTGGDKDKPLTATVKNDSAVKLYGTMQHTETADSDSNQSQINQLAAQKLKELSKPNEESTVTALGLVDVVTGSSVYVLEDMTKLIGGFYVTADTHTFENGTHLMDVRISKTDDLPQLDYVEVTED
ncbi:XkdQ/YqbQ family protein [Paenibacillus urinalis]|uniref:XkdQ/YqbQ family protein n=1 Tax=Paenibacillus urinalis TaxID=521520 RepID=UPI0019606374